MAITKGDELLDALIGIPTQFGKVAASATGAGTPHTAWYAAGVTGAGAAPGGGLNGATFASAVAGQVPIPGPLAGQTVRLARLDALQTGNIGSLWLVDRLWGNVPVVTTTTGQAVTSPTWPSRDATGTTAGVNIFFALECSSATGNGAPVTTSTLTYTNAAGTAARTATLPSFPATAPAGTWVPFSMTAGDTGARSLQTVTLGTSYVSGQVHVVAFRLIAVIPLPTANVSAVANWMTLGLPVVWDGSVPQLIYFPTSASPGAVNGSATWAQG